MFHKYLNQIRGCIHILRDTRGWTKKICCVPRLPDPDYKQQFVASDDGIWCEPEGMLTKVMFDRFKKEEDIVHNRLRNIVQSEGWPLSGFGKGNAILGLLRATRAI